MGVCESVSLVLSVLCLLVGLLGLGEAHQLDDLLRSVFSGDFNVRWSVHFIGDRVALYETGLVSADGGCGEENGKKLITIKFKTFHILNIPRKPFESAT